MHKNIKDMTLCLEHLEIYLDKWFSLLIMAIGSSRHDSHVKR